MDAVDQRAFMIALKAGKDRAGSSSLGGGCALHIGKRRRSVHLRFTCAQQIQVRAIDQKKFFCHLDQIPFDDDAAFCRQIMLVGKKKMAA